MTSTKTKTSVATVSSDVTGPVKKAVKTAEVTEVVKPETVTTTKASKTVTTGDSPSGKKSKKVSDQSTKTVTETAPVSVVVPVASETETTTAAEPEVTSTEDSFAARFSSLLDRVQALGNEVRDITSMFRQLQKEHGRFVRDNTKAKTKRQNRVKRTASGFAKPTLLSDEMYDFLGLSKGTLVGRNDVTRKLNEYVLANNLRDVKDRRILTPDSKMRTLLNIKEGDSLSYFNIQKYIKHHFVKPVVVA